MNDDFEANVRRKRAFDAFLENNYPDDNYRLAAICAKLTMEIARMGLPTDDICNTIKEQVSFANRLMQELFELEGKRD